MDGREVDPLGSLALKSLHGFFIVYSSLLCTLRMTIVYFQRLYMQLPKHNIQLTSYDYDNNFSCSVILVTILFTTKSIDLSYSDI